MMEKLSEEFWSDRYKENKTGWDLGEVSPPIKGYFEQDIDKSSRILIPGCGNAHEAEFLHAFGYTNVHVIDLSSNPLDELKKRVPSFPESHIFQGDFFEHKGEYDYIIEQTMFCAIDPQLRQQYADKIDELLSKKGILIGVMFGCEMPEGPPYGGTKEEYLKYFSPYFHTIRMEECHNSIKPRLGRELFVRIQR